MSNNQTLLAGDIGGTKSLFGIYQDRNCPKQMFKKRYKSKEWGSLDLMLSDFMKSIPSTLNTPERGCFAVAGPVSNNHCTLTNLGWDIDQKHLCNLLNLERLDIINDFNCLIYSLPSIKDNQFTIIQKGKQEKSGDSVAAFIGAGTGLGIAKGILNSNQIKALPSEGGHVEFSPRSQKEWELYNWLKNDLKIQRLSLERVVSGSGLGHIARWRLSHQDSQLHPLRNIAEKWMSNEQNIDIDLPSLVSQAAYTGDNKMKEVVNLWLSAYGSAAGDLALQELCEAGLWIAGGTAAKHLDGIRSDIFLNSFKNKGRFKLYLENIPIMALTDPEIGLYSAACRTRYLAY